MFYINNTKYIYLNVGLIVVILLLPFVVSAVAPPPPAITTSLPNPVGVTSFSAFIDLLIDWLQKILIYVSAAMFLYAGYLFVRSEGDPAKVTTARNMLLYALIGLGIILIGKGWVLIVQNFFS